MLTVTSSDLPAYNGTVLSLTGRAMLHAALDTDVIVTGSWSRMNTEFSSTMQSEPPCSTVQHFNLSGSDGGEYVYFVTVRPSNPTFIRPISASQTYTLQIQPYPPLEIIIMAESAECMVDRTAMLRGSVSLLDGTIPASTLTYTWMDPRGQLISPTAEDRSAIEVEVVASNVGEYTLTVCLDIPASGIANHCSSAKYPVSIQGTILNH